MKLNKCSAEKNMKTAAKPTAKPKYPSETATAIANRIAVVVNRIRYTIQAFHPLRLTKHITPH